MALALFMWFICGQGGIGLNTLVLNLISLVSAEQKYVQVMIEDFIGF